MLPAHMINLEGVMRRTLAGTLATDPVIPERRRAPRRRVSLRRPAIRPRARRSGV